MTAHRNEMLGGDRASLMLRGMGLFEKLAETEFFADPDLTFNRNAAMRAVLSGGNRAALSNIQIPLVPNAVNGIIQPPTNEQFLFLEVDWLGDGTDVAYYSELDLANSQHQMLGKILRLDGFASGYGSDRNLQRMSGVQLTLEDLDKAIATRVRARGADGKTGKYNAARFYFSVGSPQVVEAAYVPLTCPFKVERAEPTEFGVDFTLIDASDDGLAASIQPPTISALISNKAWPSAGTREKLSATTNSGIDWTLGTLLRANATGIAALAPNQKFATLNADGGYPGGQITIQPNGSNVVPVPFGGWTKAPYAWGAAGRSQFATGSAQATVNNPVGVVVLGASKMNGWMQPHFWGDCLNAPATKVRNEPLIYVRPRDYDTLEPLLGYAGEGNSWRPDGSTGIGAYIDVHIVSFETPVKSIASGGETWYVAVLYVYSNTSQAVVGLQAGIDANYNAQVAMTKLALAASRGEVYVDWNGIAASTLWGSSDLVVGAQVIGYLAQYHSFALGPDLAYHERGVGALRGENRILENYDDSLTADGLSATVVGGSISAVKAVSDVANEICATVMMDQAYNAAGRLALRPAGITALDRVLGLPRAPEIANDDIKDGSWKELTPRGNDRWGWGNNFKFDGVQDVAKVNGWDGNAAPLTAGVAPLGQVVDRNVPIYWWRQDPIGLKSDVADVELNWLANYTTERAVVTFDVDLSVAVGLELGEYIYVTYYAAANADGSKGWDRRLCRIEGLNIKWPKTVGITALVFNESASTPGVPLLLDDENRWILFQPRNLDTLTFVSGSPNVTFTPAAGTADRVTASWVGAIMKICPAYNPKPYPAADFATYAPAANICFASKIASVTDQLHFVLADNAPANGTVYAWRAQYCHTYPPPLSAFAVTAAGKAGVTNPWAWYLQLCDDTLGTFSNGDPGQTYPGP